MAVNMRTKGQRGEREAAALVESWGKPITDSLGMPPVELTRNLAQSQDGGYDLVGLDWLALEVKRHESTAQLSQWWKQAVRQAKAGQIPLLMYRQNRTPWKFRVRLTAAHYSPCGLASGTCTIVADLAEGEAKTWFQHELWVRMNGLAQGAKPA